LGITNYFNNKSDIFQSTYVEPPATKWFRFTLWLNIILLFKYRRSMLSLKI